MVNFLRADVLAFFTAVSLAGTQVHPFYFSVHDIKGNITLLSAYRI